MAFSYAAGTAFKKLVELYNTVGYDSDDDGQPVKNPTAEERKQLLALLDEAKTGLTKKAKK